MENVSNLKWSVNIAITKQKTGFLKNCFLKKFPVEDRTRDPWIMSSLTRPLHQNILFEIRANSNASWSAGNFCSKFRAAGISNVQIFKSLMSASNFIWKIRESKLFWFVFRVFQGMSGEFFLNIGRNFLFPFPFLPHLLHIQSEAQLCLFTLWILAQKWQKHYIFPIFWYNV